MIKNDLITTIYQQHNVNFKAVVLLDCSNLDRGAERWNASFNYKKLSPLKTMNTSIYAYYVEDDYQSIMHTKRNSSKELGLDVITKPLKYFRYKMEGNFDSEILIKIAEIAYTTHNVTHVILASGDSDFIPGVRLMQSKNIEVWGMSFKKSMSKELKASLDRYFPLGSEWLYRRPIKYHNWRH